MSKGGKPEVFFWQMASGSYAILLLYLQKLGYGNNYKILWLEYQIKQLWLSQRLGTASNGMFAPMDDTRVLSCPGCFLQEWQIGYCYWFLEVITTLVATVDKLCVKEVRSRLLC